MNKQQEKAAKPRYLNYLAAGSGVVGLLLFVGLIVWLASGFMSQGRGSHVVGEAGDKLADDGVILPPADAGPVFVAPAVPGLTAQDLLDSAVPPDDWAVAPDGVAPVAETQPLFNAPSGVGHILQFAAPGSRHAALVVLGQHSSCSWIRYDMANPQ